MVKLYFEKYWHLIKSKRYSQEIRKAASYTDQEREH
jgi:hypothetical protein